MDMGSPITRTSHRSSQGVFSHRCLRKASAANTVITGLEGSAGIAGVFSSRKIALACERNLAFMAIVGQARPDFRTISDFRKLHLAAFIDVFVAVVRLAGEAGLVKLGNVSTDGTKIQGNASRHKAMSYGYMKQGSGALAGGH